MQKNTQYSEDKKRLVIALGDPSGIGIEVTLKALGSKEIPKNMHPILIGCKRNVELIYEKLKEKGVSSLAHPRDLEIEDIPLDNEIIEGQPTFQTGKASFQWLTRASEIVLANKAKALITAPIAKHVWQLAGYNYPGQTERLAELAGVKNASMLFTAKSPYNSSRINTILATTHIPLADVPHSLKPELIIRKLDSLLSFCKKFKNNPQLSISGLNPHAGEEGQLGSEEINWIIPVIDTWRKNNPEIILEGPISPDTCWIKTAKSWRDNYDPTCPDGILALYHDQGLIPLKLIAFDYAVNTTLGLPFIRTSPDHGTGFDIAGKGIAKAQSMLSAIQTAIELSDNKNTK